MSLFHKTIKELTTPTPEQIKADDRLDQVSQRLKEVLERLRQRVEEGNGGQLPRVAGGR